MMREKANSEPQSKATPKQPEHNGKNMLKLIHQLLCMAVQHCHTYERWRTIWNLFLEKEIGVLRITKLCALHIVEWFGPKGFIKWAEDHNQLTPYQGGGH